MRVPYVSCAFDAGNIVTKAVEMRGPSQALIRLAIRPDPYTAGTDCMSHAQWFYFKLSGCKGLACTLAIEDVDRVCSYPDGFVGYETVASYDRQKWFRVAGTSYTRPADAEEPSSFFDETGDDDETVVPEEKKFIPLQRHNSDARPPPAPVTRIASGSLRSGSLGSIAEKPKKQKTGVLSWDMTPEFDSVYFAYWTPYSLERHLDVVAELAQSPVCELQVIGQTLDGRDLDVLKIGNGPLQLWVAARQHPGESMAEWCAEGLARKLCDELDPKARKLRELATVHVVPNMNPDGSVRGHLRTNAGGANLNREWAGGVYDGYDAPTLERSPEVFHVLTYLDAHGCDAYIDIHGDEEIEANFIAGAEGSPIHDEAMDALYEEFAAHLLRASPDFQHAPGVPGRGYEPSEPGDGNLSVCTNAIAQRYGCLAVTLEQPFKDTTFHTPEPAMGWSAPRALKLGSAVAEALLDCVPSIAKRKKALGLGKPLVTSAIGKPLV